MICLLEVVLFRYTKILFLTATLLVSLIAVGSDSFYAEDVEPSFFTKKMVIYGYLGSKIIR